MQARALNAVGWLHAQLGEYRPAVIHCRKALRILRSIGDRYGQASTLDSLGFARQHLGMFHISISVTGVIRHEETVP